MWMSDYIREIKKQFRDKYGFTPSRTVGGEPCFDNIPDGNYPMRIEGKIDQVKITNGTISCCNFDKSKHPNSVLGHTTTEKDPPK